MLDIAIGGPISLARRWGLIAGVVQLVRTPACHAGGRGFESRRSRQSQRWQPKRGEGVTMEDLLREYLPILIFLGLAFALVCAMLGGSYLIARQNPNSEKLSPFECGFAPFDDARGQFDVRFYLVAILFIIFDLEVAFLFPWAVALGDIGLFGFWSMMLFLAVLTVGFIYEWRKGALEWE